jgi:hypothetical protein
MKATRLFYFAMVAAIVQLSSCSKDDEKPQTIPELTTNETIPTTTTTATVSGEITGDGNATITEAGFVYSSIVAEPTTSDNKVEVTDFDDFTKELTGLASGTVYKVRAYAINKKGTGYGDLRTFETGNLAPVASNVQITGTLEVNKDLTATFTYTDAEGNAPGESTYQWYVADDATGTGEVAIDGATSATFHVMEAQVGKVIKVKVTPKAQTGTITGVEVSSVYTTAIGAETVTFIYNGVSVTYGTITSAATGKKWLDRNLGATRMAQAVDDYLAYGDYFQWGRLADGHHRVTRTGAADADATGITGVTSTTAPYETSATDVPPTDKFIINKSSATFGDWRAPQNPNLWQGVNGTNNPCPIGWRIATQTEWTAEGITSISDAYSKLKITFSGFRDGAAANGIFSSSATGGYYWTSTVPAASPTLITRIRFNATTFQASNTNRVNAYPCRCIKE